MQPDYSNNNGPVEKAVFLRLAGGDEQAFSIVFQHYYDWFYGRAFRLADSHYFAEELVQEVFVRIWEQRKFLAKADNPDAYLFRMFYRELHRMLRREAAEKRKHNAAIDMPMDDSLSREDTEMLERRIEVFREALNKFPPQQRAVFKLIKEEGMSREAVARQLDISPNTVRNHLAEAIKRLRELARRVTLWF